MSGFVGVDIGETRLRIACRERDGRIAAVVARDVPPGAASSGAIADPQLVGGILEEAHEELQTRERRCILAVGVPAATLRPVYFPRMNRSERGRAARFEAQRYESDQAGEMLVRLHALGQPAGRFALGITRAEMIGSRMRAVRCARLRPIAVDYDACAFKRALPDFDAVLDVGHRKTRVHFLGGAVPRSTYRDAGGFDVTQGIARDLQLDQATAEKRKRILGTEGAGERARSDLLAAIGSMLEEFGDLRVPLARLAVVGNGARLPKFLNDVRRATGLDVSVATSALCSGTAHAALLESAASDWMLAAGLST